MHLCLFTIVQRLTDRVGIIVFFPVLLVMGAHHDWKRRTSKNRLIVGVDVSVGNISNAGRAWGRHRRGMHHMSELDHQRGGTRGSNCYLSSIRVVGTALQATQTTPINVYRFGCPQTTTHSVLPLNRTGVPSCPGTEAALACYRDSVPRLTMSGPVRLARLVDVQMSHQYTVLLVCVASDTVDVKGDAAAIERASQYPISIIVVLPPSPYTGEGNTQKTIQESTVTLPVLYTVLSDGNPFRGIPLPTHRPMMAASILHHLPDQYEKIAARGLLGENPARDGARTR
ncbi:hypothetical protein KIPB_003511 [Kipferlia bialata]|uniref:Copine C-terminal domain-containing protein n=1 Tax=Kipferlia bialata TaxID=797122 RepID=A0A9K3CVK2_9EUKA|nr:hypothetical protein KIPB_003511 [Kipferlia bialata]|eukprot:g3511.t1